MTSATNPARVCVPVCVRRAGELPAAVGRAAESADLVELRFDCLEGEELGASLGVLPAVLANHPAPFIFTLRAAEQGGRRPPDPAESARFRRELLAVYRRAGRAGDFVDLELSDFDGVAGELAAAGFELICSHHDFGGIPAELEAVYEGMAATGARVLKIAVLARDATDCLPVFRLLERARREGHDLIAIAMGGAGLLTRILAPSRGSFLTFGALDREGATAPGQVTAAELRRLYRVESLTDRTQVVGLVGRPVAHSLSPHMHNAAFRARRLDAVYIPFEVADVGEFVRRMAHPRTRELDWRLRGLSVTAPHKAGVMKWLDWAEPKAREIGAVNTLVAEGGELRGYNTDAEAAVAPLGGVVELGGARVALLGAGGAARALLWSLRAGGARTVVFARDAARAQETAEAFGAQASGLAGARFDGFDLVVNATPLGTRGPRQRETPAGAEALRGARVVYDLVYNPAETSFMREGRLAGCRVVGGLRMLAAQAAEQFRLWTGVEAPAGVMLAEAERELSNRSGRAEEFESGRDGRLTKERAEED